jgi:hypothetical protein
MEAGFIINETSARFGRRNSPFLVIHDHPTLGSSTSVGRLKLPGSQKPETSAAVPTNMRPSAPLHHNWCHVCSARVTFSEERKQVDVDRPNAERFRVVTPTIRGEHTSHSPGQWRPYTLTLVNPCFFLKGGVMYSFLEESLPWFESKLNLTRLEYSLCTYFEQILRNIRSETNLVVSDLFIRIRLQAINCSSFELKMFSSLWCSCLVFECYQIVALKDAVHHRGKGTITISFTQPLCPSDKSSKGFRREMIPRDLDAVLGTSRMFRTQYCFEPPCAVRPVSGSEMEHLTCPYYVYHREWELLHKHWHLL